MSTTLYFHCWTKEDNTNVLGGQKNSADSAEDCQTACINNGSCNWVDWNPVDLGLETRGSAKLQALLTITSTGTVEVKMKNYNRWQVCEKFAHICYKENSRFSSTLRILCAVRAYVWVYVSSTNTVLPPNATLNAVMPKYVLCLSVCPSVMFRYRDHIGWNTWKISLRPNSLAAHIDATSAIWCSGNTVNRLLYGVVMSKKSAISVKWC